LTHRHFSARQSKYGEVGGAIAGELVASVAERLFQSPFNSIRRVEWQDIRELDEPFASEELESPHGAYFDQRFVNFLAENFADIDNRADDGADIRLWPSNEAVASLPAAILVQCKRERRNIAKTVVKSLWADVEAEGAGSGLVVPTSCLSPGAREVRTARGYAIDEADRETLREWVEVMRARRRLASASGESGSPMDATARTAASTSFAEAGSSSGGQTPTTVAAPSSS
jgi:restriction system protein